LVVFATLHALHKCATLSAMTSISTGDAWLRTKPNAAAELATNASGFTYLMVAPAQGWTFFSNAHRVADHGGLQPIIFCSIFRSILAWVARSLEP
jgi:hypothetical protein